MRRVRLWIKMAAFMVFAIALGFVLLVCAYMLPRTRMKGHVAQSDEVFNYEGVFPQVMAGMKSSQLDNFTDAIMLSTAIVPSSGNVWRDALQNIRYEYEDTDMVQGLNDYANDVEEQKPYRYEMAYSRYWHGYLIILKPLLLFLNVSEIRMLNMIMQGILLLSLFYLVQRRLGAVYIMPLFMAVMVLNPVVLPLSLQFSWVWYICLICSIVIMCTDRIPGDEWYFFVFLGTGALTSYFDLLTYPLITLGVPLLLFLIKWKTLKVQAKVLYILQLAMTWGIGYDILLTEHQ